MICGMCHIDKPDSDFYKGNNYRCKACVKIVAIKWSASNSDKVKKIQIAWRKKNKAHRHDYYAQYYYSGKRQKQLAKVAIARAEKRIVVLQNKIKKLTDILNK